MANSKTEHVKYAKTTKNKIMYMGSDEFGAIYIPKSWLGEDVPQELDIEVKW